MINKKDNDIRIKLHNKECDPSISLTNEESTNKQDGEADVGILGCGYDQYCMESQYSKLGGFCVSTEHEQQRQQQEGGVWNHRQMALEHQEEDFHCELSSSFEFDCGEVNLTYGGTRTECDTVPQCLPHCGNETCLVPSSSIEISDSFKFDVTVTYFYRYLFCYDIYEPIISKTCFSTTYRTYYDKDSSLRCSFFHLFGSYFAPCPCVMDEQGCIYFDCRKLQTPYGQGGIGSTCDENGKYP